MFVSLGFWQLDRADGKLALAAELQQRSAAQPLAWQEIAALGDSIGNMTRVMVSGEYQNEISFLVLFQFYQGRAGYELVTPFKPDNGGPLILLSRGWLTASTSSERPEIPVVTGHQSVRAQVYVPEQSIPAAEVSDTDWPVRLPRLSIAQAERLLAEPVYPYVFRLEANQPGVQSRHWVAPRIATRGHFAYAIQWFGITLLVLIAALFYSSNVAALLSVNQR
jgi:surfeit locus 1 family protein